MTDIQNDDRKVSPDYEPPLNFFGHFRAPRSTSPLSTLTNRREREGRRGNHRPHFSKDQRGPLARIELDAARAAQSLGHVFQHQRPAHRPSNIRPKAHDSEVETLYAFHVDAEVRPKDLRGEEFTAARAELLARIQADPMPPSIIVGFLHGYTLYWLVDPTPVTKDNLTHLKICEHHVA